MSTDLQSFNPVPEMTAKRLVYIPQNHRRILCVFPKYSRSFGTFHHAYPLMGNVKAMMPPLGILFVAAYMPKEWEVRFIDENISPITKADYQWADAIIISGMHIQKKQINRINELAHEEGIITVVGGTSPTSCPEYYPEFDIVHMGELGDATDKMIEFLDLNSERPEQQIHLETQERLPIQDFPTPAYNLVQLEHYFIGSIQFSSGCPYNCEFCDVPETYGRKPRFKTPEQLLAELDAILAAGNPGAVYFVDDNFIGDRRATTELLPHLIDWQKRNGYPVRFSAEATLNIARFPKLLEMMREANFVTIFCGIETPELDALKSLSKHNDLSMSVLEAVKTMNSYGMEVVSGIILGLDTDTPQTADNIIEFIRSSNIAMLTINLVHALPKTPLWRRLEQEGRLIFDDGRDSNVDFLMPYEQVVDMWKYCMANAYAPEFLYKRFAYNVEHTFPNRIKVPNTPERASWSNIRKGLTLLSNVLIKIGLFGSYRQTFWKFALPLLKKGDIESLIQVAITAHHLIEFANECTKGKECASHYSQKLRNVQAVSVASS